MADSLAVLADSVATDTATEVLSAITADALASSNHPPFYAAVIFMSVLLLSAYFIIDFVVNYDKTKGNAIFPDATPKAYHRGCVMELLWVALIIASGVTVDFVANSITNPPLICAGILAALSVVYFSVSFVINLRKGASDSLFSCAKKIGVEVVWIFWLIIYSVPAIADVFAACCRPDDFEMSLNEYLYTYGFNRLEGLLLFAVRVVIATRKYKKVRLTYSPP